MRFFYLCPSFGNMPGQPKCRVRAGWAGLAGLKAGN